MIETNYEFLKNDLDDVVRIFFKSADDVSLRVDMAKAADSLEVTVKGDREERRNYPLSADIIGDELLFKRYAKRCAKSLLYEYLADETGKKYPYGALTGIRPVRLFRHVKEVEKIEDVDDYFLNFLHVSSEKLALIKKIYDVQKPFVRGEDASCDLYVGVPFCKGRCSYCSFVSCDIDKAGEELVEEYISALVKEIRGTLELLDESGITVRSIYFGGGTPSSPTLSQIERLLEAVSSVVSDGMEFTFEAGRPDSINVELLKLLRKYRVNRISVNPQTIHDETLARIGRNHTYADYVRAMAEARDFGGFIINTDLIMGLEGETQEDFMQSLKAIADVAPQNITVHTLCLKAGSKLKENVLRLEDGDYESLSQRTTEFLRSCGYDPYYIYRQKYSAGNLENLGYAKQGGFECLYNIDNMEELASVVACGANAVTKRIFLSEGKGRIERYGNPKDIRTYVAKTGEIIKRKRALFDLTCDGET